MKRSKWAALMLLASGALVFQGACLSAFWQGLSQTGFPTDNRWLNLAFDVASQVALG